MRKIAHGALKSYGNGLLKLEKLVLEEADALCKRFDAKSGEAFDPVNDLSKSNIYSFLTKSPSVALEGG